MSRCLKGNKSISALLGFCISHHGKMDRAYPMRGKPFFKEDVTVGKWIFIRLTHPFIGY
jgi:hypothetical protein